MTTANVYPDDIEALKALLLERDARIGHLENVAESHKAANARLSTARQGERHGQPGNVPYEAGQLARDDHYGNVDVLAARSEFAILQWAATIISAGRQ